MYIYKKTTLIKREPQKPDCITTSGTAFGRVVTIAARRPVGGRVSTCEEHILHTPCMAIKQLQSRQMSLSEPSY